MNVGLQLNIGARLEQKLSPQMIQSLKLLQVNSLELEMMIKQELEMNPILEMEEEVQDLEADLEKKESEESLEEVKNEKEAEEIDWDEYFNEGFDLGYGMSEGNTGAEEKFERPPVYDGDLTSHLIEQLNERNIPKKIYDLVYYLIYCLNEDGLLLPDENVADDLDSINEKFDQDNSFHINPDFCILEDIIQGKADLLEQKLDIREAFHVLKTMEPAGIGAQSLQECLLIQAYRTIFKSRLAIDMLENSFDMLQKLQISNLARKYEVPPLEIQEAVAEISVLNPKPGSLVGNNKSGTVIPDVRVYNDNGKLKVELNDKSVPNLRISKTYTDILATKKGKKESESAADEKKFVKQKLNAANWLIKSIDQRKNTIMKVTSVIVDLQRDFFIKGPGNIKPLILQDVADRIEMHISTVNRVTNGKFVQTEWGVFELKTFFSSSVTQEDGSEMSAVQTKEAIKQVIAEEDPKKPLSDQKIVDVLKKKDISVARRTVAKYREQMNILPARMRKKF